MVRMRMARLTVRCGMAGTLIGLAAGLIEAARLSSFPRAPLLLTEVRPVIWFLAPLVDLAAGAMVGLLLAPLVISLSGLGTRRRAYQGIALLAYAALATLLVLEARAAQVSPPLPWRWSVAMLGFALWTAWYWRAPLGRFLAADRRPLDTAFGAALVACVAVALGGMWVFERGSDFATRRAIAGSALSGTRTGKPNVVVVTLDTVRADHLSLYGYSRQTTPNLDRRAKLGVVFENAVAPSSWTLASHASMLTGLLPHQHGANWFAPIDPARWMMTEVLKAHGYDTAGFSSNYGYGEAGWGIAQGFQTYDDMSAFARHNLKMTWLGGEIIEPIYYSMIRPDTSERLEAGLLNRDLFRRFQPRPERPFFLFVNYFDAHAPYIAPAPYDTRFGQASDALLRKTQRLLFWDDSLRVSSGERESLIAGYDNCLAYLDWELEDLLQFLASQPGWSNTIVVITSDHGEAFGEHGLYTHGFDLHREVLHVPLVIFGPGIPAGVRVTQTVDLRDLFATILDMTLGARASCPLPSPAHTGEPLSRHSLRRYWEPGFNPGPGDDMAISELAGAVKDEGAVSLTTSEWQYIRDSEGREELYQWAASPQETDNLAASLPEEAAKLRTLLSERIGSSLGPWAERRYLLALPPPGVHGAKAADADSAAVPVFGPLDRIGAAQTCFPQRTSRLARRTPPDEELLRSLPYH